jgi:hypothetical protein
MAAPSAGPESLFRSLAAPTRSSVVSTAMEEMPSSAVTLAQKSSRNGLPPPLFEAQMRLEPFVLRGRPIARSFRPKDNETCLSSQLPKMLGMAVASSLAAWLLCL